MQAGLDIGGANIKVWREDSTGVTLPFPVWKAPQDLKSQLQSLLDSLQIQGPIAITMTAELCDCFPSKEEGVRFILNSIPEKHQLSALVYTAHSTFVSLKSALQIPLPCAAVNWLALAKWICTLQTTGSGLMIDMGSTTTDLVPIIQGETLNKGNTDFARLQEFELVYTGMRRTPLGPLLGQKAAQEWFSTTADAHLLLGNLTENPSNMDTADGKPFTIEASSQRLARMFCVDKTDLQPSDILKIASLAIGQQTCWITKAIEMQEAKTHRATEWFYLCGEGESFLHSILQTSHPKARKILFSSQFGADASSCACAFSILQLAKAHAWKSR